MLTPVREALKYLYCCAKIEELEFPEDDSLKILSSLSFPVAEIYIIPLSGL